MDEEREGERLGAMEERKEKDVLTSGAVHLTGILPP